MAKLNEMAAAELPLNDAREPIRVTVPLKLKRQAKPGTRRVTVNLSDEEYKYLVRFSANQMREPNNMLSWALQGQVSQILGNKL